jgi:hypothetical protein
MANIIKPNNLDKYNVISMTGIHGFEYKEDMLTFIEILKQFSEVYATITILLPNNYIVVHSDNSRTIIKSEQIDEIVSQYENPFLKKLMNRSKVS